MSHPYGGWLAYSQKTCIYTIRICELFAQSYIKYLSENVCQHVRVCLKETRFALGDLSGVMAELQHTQDICGQGLRCAANVNISKERKASSNTRS